MRKFERVFNKVAKFRSDMRNPANSKSVKELIGDSTSNNRTVTVNQAIRYLEYTGQRKTAKQVKAAYSVLRPVITYVRAYDGVVRTDAIDLDEFVRTFRHEVMDTKNLRQKVAIALRGV